MALRSPQDPTPIAAAKPSSPAKDHRTPLHPGSFEEKGRLFSRQEVRTIQRVLGALPSTGDGTGLQLGGR
ncbi:hypothetical protein TorRG33x02_003320 [Trema orientale]|uniref:Uncharacterized protein n=1 Tax=Trema orientale TaxID=63057 RepID=A0A2P5G1U0_TREOI|nr:hypothetical protein TorRG33x02_003320 [Trema orientale]